ncbi:MAG: hypothetical protein HYY04_11835, partial [Chloroflexi bacterium]|nr:hypothetical protein [Chloroflexota bacterium]
TGLSPETAYQFLIDTDGVAAGDVTAPYRFTTGPSLLPGAPNSVVGRLLTESWQVAPSCPVLVRLRDGDTTGSAGDSTWLSVLTGENGEWQIELQARTADLASFFDYQVPGDVVQVESLCGSRGIVRQSYGTSAIDPAAGFGDLGDLQLQTVITVPLSFVTGWNLMAMPVEPTATVLAETLGQALIAEGVTASQVVRWNEALGSWSAHLVGWTSNNFAIDPTRGYFVRVTGGTGTAGFTGHEIRTPQTVRGMVVGWNLIAVPNPVTYLAESLGQAIRADGISASQVVRWNDAVGSWSAHLVGWTSNNFAIQLGRGYFVRVTAIDGDGEFTP